jgi:hypothetical protein
MSSQEEDVEEAEVLNEEEPNADSQGTPVIDVE